ncbi:putative disease resistance protein RGA1 [Quercus lobata]|uniref:putative disease resistance protein RGA1 n=1 Tax=Quercus lobata TaxID=97700 RepID=UPI0012482223|nr:putative disease resistance protein RGA1 [Quercus lobata]
MGLLLEVSLGSGTPSGIRNPWIKAHLAGVSGYDIVACVDVNQDIQKEAQETQKSNKKLKSASSTSSAGKRKITSASTSKIKDKIVTEEEFEIILDDIVDGLVTNVISLVTEHTNFDWDFKDKEELKNLLGTLCKIHVMLPDAQERQVSDESVKIWLTELKDVVYDVDNVLDKFKYKIVGQKVHIQNQMMNQVPSISFSNFDEVKTTKHMLDKFVNDVDGLGLKIVDSKPKISLHNIDSLNDSEFIGREHGDDLFLKLKSTLDRLTIPSLKRCFLYCANFPKDYDITKDELIQHWMAQELLKPSEESMVMEDIGNKYFNTLLDKFFLQNAKKDEYGNIISCRMNDLVHDFVLSISKSKSSSSDNFSQVRSLFVGFDGQTTPGISFKGDGFTKLCTLILENADFGNILSEFKSLHVLKLYRYKRIELPETIGVLIHLRFLHISDSEIKYLPNSITMLFNLQTLRIKECPNFVDLPEDLSNLINLRHICIIDCEIAAPKNVGRLTCLQTLPDFCVGRDEGYQIKELGPLKNLRGEINICNLENVEDEEEAKVLEGLQPHPNLKSLTVSCYGGKKFPSWVGLSSLYHNLIEINLSYCWECEEVPTLGQLPCLRVLEIIGMGKVRCIGSEFYIYSDGSYRNTALFPALRILKLEEMETLEEWKDAKELTTADEVLVTAHLRFPSEVGSTGLS